MKGIVLIFVGASLLAVGLGITSVRIEPRAATSVEIVICDGVFRVAAANGQSDQPTAIVQANRSIRLLFRSADYVYAVHQPDTGVSAVVTPGKAAAMSINVGPGTWQIRKVEGCGKLFSTHEASFSVVAVE